MVTDPIEGTVDPLVRIGSQLMCRFDCGAEPLDFPGRPIGALGSRIIARPDAPATALADD